MNINKTKESLEKNGYSVSIFKNKDKASAYINLQIDKTTVGMGGSMTLKEIGIFDSLSKHNKVYSHSNLKANETVQEIQKKAMDTDIYITSANGISETGEMVNIDGNGNRVASTLFGHEKVYFVVGINKIAPTLEDAIFRAKNIASPLNAKRLGCETPCVIGENKCYDCNCGDRICNAMVIYFKKMNSCDMEVLIIEENLGY